MSYVLVLSLIKVITVLVGVVFLYITGKAYAKTRSRSMAILFVAVGLMVLAAVAEGAAFQILGLSLDESHVVEAVVTLAAFMVFLYSIVSHRFS